MGIFIILKLHPDLELWNPPALHFMSLQFALSLLLGTVIAGFLAGVVLLWLNQERVVFQPPRAFGHGRLAAEVDHLDFFAEDGQPLLAYVVGGSLNSVAPAFLAFHGNADLAEWLIPWAAQVHETTGATVFLPEYRGYAGLPGRPTYLSGRLDARAAWQAATSLLPGRARPLALFGHSLGSAIATQLASEAHPSALVLQAPFTSARAMAARLLFPAAEPIWSRTSRVHYDTVARVASYPFPVHVAHGTLDRVVPLHMGRAVYAAARCPGELLVVRDAGHNDIVERGGPDYWRWLAGIVSETRLGQ